MRRRVVAVRSWAALVVLGIVLSACGETPTPLIPDRVRSEPARTVTVTDELEGRLTARLVTSLSPARRDALMDAARHPPALIADPDAEFDTLYLDMVGECDDVDVHIGLVDGVATIETGVTAREVDTCGLMALSVIVGVTIEDGLGVEVGG